MSKNALRLIAPVVMVASVLAPACSSGADGSSGGAGGSGTATTSSGAHASGAVTSSTGSVVSGTGTGTTSATSSGSNGTGGGSSVPDPNLDGPYVFTEIDDSVTNASDGNAIPIHCAYPTSGPKAGPYPVIVVAHGFQLPAAQYVGYVKRLASFGYVALTADFPAGFVNPSNVDNAHDLLAALDWAGSAAALAGKADTSTAGMTGHSLGGKLALLAATLDPRVKATITLDPVDSSMGCTPQACPDVSALMPSLHVPTGFIGETIDATAGPFGQACAPAADNFATFYAGTNSPSFQVTVAGANHMSFLDDVATCGFFCSVCNTATAPNATVNALSKAMVVAFYERYLRGNTAYDSYLTGAEATQRYVNTSLATITAR